MKNKKTFILLIVWVISFFLFFINLFAYNLISNKFWFQYNQNLGDNTINYDNYNLNNASGLGEEIELYTGDNGVLVKQVSRYESWYIDDWLRLKISWIWDITISPYKPFFSSNRFGRFEIKDEIKGYKKTDWSYCSWELVYYSLTGSIYSYGNYDWFDGSNGNWNYWGKMDLIENESYFCPGSKEFKMTFDSSHIWKIEISSGTIIFEYNVQNPYWKSVVINSLDAFDNKKIYINWNIKSNYINNNSVNYTWEVWNNSGGLVLWISWNLKNNFEVKKIIDKNVEKFTRNKISINLNPLDSLYVPLSSSEQFLQDFSDSREVFYYNYEWLTDVNWLSNEDNNGVVLKLWSTWTWKIAVDGEKILIVKWWNLYINSNIYNKTKDSILTIVVQRDSTNKKNWGNVYINPDVTNIDAIIIAEWSILSFIDIPNYRVLNSIDNYNLLKKQLLIYGLLFSKNTIWLNKAPYGTDTYIKNWGSISDTPKYNLENLRSFEVELVTGAMTGSCNEENRIRSMGGDKYMFAGRKECYIDDNTDPDLKGSEKIAPLLIYYNNMLNILVPKILKVY